MLSWTLRFHAPQAMRFVVRFVSRLKTSTSSTGDLSFPRSDDRRAGRCLTSQGFGALSKSSRVRQVHYTRGRRGGG